MIHERPEVRIFRREISFHEFRVPSLIHHRTRSLAVALISPPASASAGIATSAASKIIEEAGIAKGTYYYYFKSKEQMLEEVIDMMLHAEEVYYQKAVEFMKKVAHSR